MNNLKVVNRSILSQKPDAIIFDIMQSHGSVLGNPYYRSNGSRDERIARFRTWLWANIESKTPSVIRELSKIKQAVLSGENVYLMCCCKPAACHGDIIKSCIEWCITK